MRFESYPLQCECGQTTKVTEAQAGSSVECPCGAALGVPSLGKLRLLQGEGSIPESPEDVIDRLFHSGQLPPTRSCAECGFHTDETVVVIAELERVYAAGGSTSGPLTTLSVLYFLISPLLWISQELAKGIATSSYKEEPQTLGRERTYQLPLAICRDCRKHLKNSRRIRDRMRRVPEYDALLADYPRATFCLKAETC